MIHTETAYDVVVVGSGGGGLRAAIGAAQAGARTLVVCRGKANRSGATLLAGANISADIACDGATLSRLGISHSNKDDTPDTWFRDVVREGFYLNNQDLVRLFVDTAGDRLEELLQWGLTVRGMEGEREVSVFGSDILDALYGRAKTLGVEFLPDTLFTDLLQKDGQVTGVVCVDLASGTLKAIPAGAVVLCTGARQARDVAVPGREAKGVYLAMEYLTGVGRSYLNSKLKDGDFISAADKDVIVVGGGDTGSDCIGVALRQGCRSVKQLVKYPRLPDRRTDDNRWPEWPKVDKLDYSH